MNYYQRFKKLTFWNKIGFGGSVASIIGVPLAILLYFFPYNSQNVQIENRIPVENSNLIGDKPESTKNIKNEKPYPSKNKSDYKLRKIAQVVFQNYNQIITTFIKKLPLKSKYIDYQYIQSGYGIRENPYRLVNRIGLRNKYYSEEVYMPLNEVIIHNNNYIFKLDGIEFWRIATDDKLDYKILEKKATTSYLEKINAIFNKDLTMK